VETYGESGLQAQSCRCAHGITRWNSGMKKPHARKLAAYQYLVEETEKMT